MHKGRELLHLPVILFGSGREIAQVEDFFWHGQEVKALIIARKPGGERMVLPSEHIRRWGKNTLCLLDETGLMPLNSFLVPSGWHRSQDPLGMTIVTEEGREVGRVGDLCVEQSSIIGLEVTDGLLQDLLTGRYVLPWDGQLGENTHSIIIRAQTDGTRD